MTGDPAVRRGAIVVCGGRSTRMGRDKATLDFLGEPLVARVVRRVARAVEQVVVAARPGQELPPLPRGDVRVAWDEVADRGPLAGLAAGLRESRAEAVFATACDAPFVSAGVVARLFGRLAGADVVIIEEAGRPNPLCAVYRRTVLPHVEELLASDRLRPVYLLERVPSVRVAAEELRDVDPDLRSMLNCNDTDAYAAALAAAGPLVRVEFYDVARVRAGVASLAVEGATLAEVLAEAGERLPGLVPDVVRDGRLSPHFRASLDGRRFLDDPSEPLPAGAAVLLLSATSGG